MRSKVEALDKQIEKNQEAFETTNSLQSVKINDLINELKKKDSEIAHLKSLNGCQRFKGACKYYISRFSPILDPPLNKQNKHGLRPPTPPKMLI